jgi:AraC-like DNA-binding protein
MREACKLLLKGEMIKQIAPELGFKQVAHFSREFKRSFGVSPRLFAQANGKLK